ncbi:MAG: PstS family phosphate ABC transporter substrate-binding protein [Phycisphaeraceae bacterium]
MNRLNILLAGMLLGTLVLGAGACERREQTRVRVDGSSTVFPISEAVAEEFQAAHPDIRVTVGVSGTGGGFKKFVQAEIDIADASRPIKAEEMARAEEAGIEFIELPVAYDGLSVVVNPANDWVDYLTVEELRRIWQPGSDVQRWSDVRPEWPDREIELVGPGTDSGTFDYFTETIVGEAGASRSDYMPSEDDNVLVQAVSGERDALGYFGYAYYVENEGRLRAIPIQAAGQDQPVMPSYETIADGSYQPLARPEFIYVRAESAERPEVQQFIRFYMTEGPALVEEVGYVPLPEQAYAVALERFESRKTGSAFAGADASRSVLEVLQAD